MSDNRRGIKSFVLRQGRLTEGQSRALEHQWPRFGLTLDSGTISPLTLFQNAQPLILEIGFGMGESLAQQAELNPGLNYLGIEVHRPGVGHLLMLLEQQGLSNVRVFAEDSIEVLHRCIPPNCLSGVQVFFPDPWHKKRHHKRRIINQDFVTLLTQKLKSGGIVHLATDWVPYAEAMVEVFADFPQFQATVVPDRPETKFERRGLRLGHKVTDLAFVLVDQ